MTKIKICGLTNRQDALRAVDEGADALGFIGVQGTPRFVRPDVFSEIVRELPVTVQRVIVVHRPEDAAGYGADFVQHYAEDADSADALVAAERRIRAFRVRDEASLQEIADYAAPVEAVLLDAYHHEKLGGSGAVFDWDIAVRAKQLTARPVLLAGGLNAENVQEALERVRPDGVDVSSGVESFPGVKDNQKLAAFIRAVREWDSRQ